MIINYATGSAYPIQNATIMVSAQVEPFLQTFISGVFFGMGTLMVFLMFWTWFRTTIDKVRQ